MAGFTPSRESLATVDLDDDDFIGFGDGDEGKITWDTSDANANALFVEVPSGGAVDVPVFVLGIGHIGQDLGLFDGITEPEYAVLDADRDSYISLGHSADDVSSIYVRTNAASGDTTRREIVQFSSTATTINGPNDDIDTIIESVNLTPLVHMDAALDAVGIGAAPTDGAIWEATPGAVTRTAASAVGALNVPADTINYDNASGTNAIWALLSFGTPTITNDNATLTLTDAATIYVAGVPTASTNVSISNTARAIWLAAGGIRLDDSVPVVLGAGQDATIDYDGTDVVLDTTVAGSGQLIVQDTRNPGAGAQSVQVATLYWGHGTANATDGDDAYLSLALDGDTTAQLEAARIGWEITDVTEAGPADDADIVLSSLTNGVLTERVRIDGSAGSVNIDADLSFTGAQTISTTANDLTLAPAGDVIFRPNGTAAANAFALSMDGSVDAFQIHHTESGRAPNVEVFAADGDGTDNVALRLFRVGTQAAHSTNAEYLEIAALGASAAYVIGTNAPGTGTARNLQINDEGTTWAKFLAGAGVDIGSPSTSAAAKGDLSVAGVSTLEGTVDLTAGSDVRITNGSGTAAPGTTTDGEIRIFDDTDAVDPGGMIQAQANSLTFTFNADSQASLRLANHYRENVELGNWTWEKVLDAYGSEVAPIVWEEATWNETRCAVCGETMDAGDFIVHKVDRMTLDVAGHAVAAHYHPESEPWYRGLNDRIEALEAIQEAERIVSGDYESLRRRIEDLETENEQLRTLVGA